MLDVLYLLGFIALTIFVLWLFARWSPEHFAWQRIDKYYYALALIGIVLFFGSDTIERDNARWAKRKIDYARSLKSLARLQPVFSESYPTDPGVADGYYDLMSIVLLADGCAQSRPQEGGCVAASAEALEIKRAFGGLSEPSIDPSQAAAIQYANAYCAAVSEISRGLSTLDGPGRPIRLKAQAQMTRFMNTGKPDRDLHMRYMMQASIQQVADGLAGPKPRADEASERYLSRRAYADQEAAFAMTVLSAATPCPVSAEDIRAAAPPQARWKAEWDALSTKASRNDAEIAKSQRLEQRAIGQDMNLVQLRTLIFSFWPYALALAVCLKFAKASFIDPKAAKRA